MSERARGGGAREGRCPGACASRLCLTEQQLTVPPPCSRPRPRLAVGGNHEASNYLWELYYGGWAAPNIYFLGYAGVVQFGGLRIAGLSGIYKDQHYPLVRADWEGLGGSGDGGVHAGAVPGL